MYLNRKWLMFSITLFFILAVAAGCSSESKNDGSKKNDSDDYGEAVDYTITGIEPGAGITVTTEKALEEYDNLQGWELEQASTAAMAAELDKAMKKKSPIIITGWNPHWTFAKYPDMKYLDDPKGVYGGEEKIKTLARKGLKKRQTRSI
ncbi:glycine betaine ABC transporter substrate-binding protein [Virgibacillus halophilus]|uniref:Glycine betaine ABC transporter substrate-binding protein n=1 Tax=Tigheibacillus halophilus TaxID=361280 RepID=A0ABU5C9K5_9BACI|nr:glycine betaine ABC transporter substrate-binding protein [Virgibacillus halophilus]